MATIPASQLVTVTPSVISAGGTGLDIIGMILTSSTRVPIGTVATFTGLAAVQSYFGAASEEAYMAGWYFPGFTGANKTPGSLKYAQYNPTAVDAYLRGGNISTLTLAQLQSISGSLAVTMDGFPRSAGSVNLASAASFSAAATTIQTALNGGGANPTVGQGTAAIAASTSGFTASIAGNLMTVTAVSSGTIVNGTAVSGGTVLASTFVLGQVSGTAGGVGTYAVNLAQTVASTALTGAYGTMTVSAMTSGAFAVGQQISGTSVVAGTQITQLGTGTGQTGTYFVNNNTVVSSTTITAVGAQVAVTYDSQSGAFVITSGVQAASATTSTAAFATGTAAAPLLLTSATGAVLSQGAAAATPAIFMAALTAVDSGWVTFTTSFDPDGGVGNLQKQAFAAWKNTQPNLYGYVAWDNDASPTTQNPASSSLGQVLKGNGDSGTMVLWAADAALDATSGQALAAFAMGAAAAIDFTQTQGRITFAYKSTPGLVADVTTAQVASNLLANGYNFYGAYGQANQTFVLLQNGTVTGQYLWFDSYVNQIWLNNQFRLALLTLLATIKSIPYNRAGNSLIEQALMPVIQAGLNFGAFAPGTISASEAQQVNAQAGQQVANTLQAQGWYLQVLQASSAVRAARGSPPCTFFYLDRGSIQQINLASVATQ